jgi:NADPH2:quinone reductase
MKSIVATELGGPEVLVLRDRDLPPPGRGQARVAVHATGINYIDVYHRTGRAPLPLPLTPGTEGAGVVTAVGEGVTDVKPGDRVVYASEVGSYAEEANVNAWRLVPIPDGLGFVEAAAAMLQGMTARYLVHETYRVQRGDNVLVHAAAGGTGQWIVQMARAAGARVLATVGTEEKAALARAAGADEIILYRQKDFAAEVARLTGGAKCAVVYDGVGKDTFAGGLDALRPRGMMVLFGASSGAVPPFDPQTLQAKGSLYLTRPTLAHYTTNRADTLALAAPVLEGLAAKRFTLRIDRVLPLADAAEAHRLLESRATAGKLVLAVR